VGEWIISIPVWGQRYVKIFAEQCRPALLAAAERAQHSVRFLIHTDEASSEPIRLSLGQVEHELRPLPKADQWWQQMTLAHREVLKLAQSGVIVMPLTADMIVSPEVFEACARRFNEGKRLILCCGIRAVDDGTLPNRSSSRELLGWAWAHRHALTTESMWPDGRSGNWTGIYFERDENVVFHARYPHPIAVMPHGHRDRFFPTIDCNYSENFRRDEVHVVTSPDELAAIEMSPREKALEFVDPSFSERVKRGSLQALNEMSGWIYDHRISIQGDPALVDNDAGIRPPQPSRKHHLWHRARRFR